MKKICLFVLLLGLIVSLSACGKVEIATQDIYDAGQIEAMLQNHESVSIREVMDGKVWYERYLTKEYVYEYFPDEEFDWAGFMTDDASYAYSNGDYLRYLFITPDGVTNDFASDRAEKYAYVLTANIVDETIESASKKDGRITVKSLMDEEPLAAEDGLASVKTEYALDAKTRELISVIADYTYEDGTVFRAVTEVAHDAEAPEMIDVFLKYANQTEGLRHVTIVTNPGTEKEVSQNFQIPKGLIIGFTWGDAFEDKVELYTDAACTGAYDPYVNTDSDLTVYIKWNV
jgi:hypothetical protein